MIKTLRAVFLFVFNIQLLLSWHSVNAANFNINFTPNTKAISFINLDTDTQVYSKNADEKMYPASTTKIMTYIIVSEKVSDLENTKVTVKEEVLKQLDGTGSSVSGIEPGEVLSVKQLLYCLMIPSGNDAAVVLADFVGDGDIKKFVNMMNEKAKELGCTGSHFANPHGLYAANHYVTANDMVKITKYALTLPDFLSISSEVISYARGEDKPPLVTTNSMINKTADDGYYYYQYAKGIKTGHLDESGYCIISMGIYSGYNYLCVALGAPSVDEDGNDIEKNYSMLDSRSLYRWAFTSLDIKTVLNEEDPVGEIKLNLAWNRDTLILTPESNVSSVLPKNVSVSSIEVKVEKPESINAPVTKGQKIGTAILSYANQEIARVDLVASESVDKSAFLSFINVLNNIITSKIFIVSLVIVFMLVVAYVVMMFSYRKKKLMGKNKRNLRR